MSESPHLDSTATYWDRAAGSKVFTHPLDLTRFRAHVRHDAAVLDLGCGYGRLAGELAAAGYHDVLGADTSTEMVRLAGRDYPGARFVRIAHGGLPFDTGAFGAVLLFAVLTCIPDDAAQEALMREVDRVLAPGGLLVVSDYPLQKDERNRQRYMQDAPRFAHYGMFRLPDGGIVRHHAPARFSRLLSAFDLFDEVRVAARTMNGNPAEICQFWARRRARTV